MKEISEFSNLQLDGDDTIDGKSRKKAYAIFDNGFLKSMNSGTVECLQQIHAYLFGGLYDFAGKIRIRPYLKVEQSFAVPSI